jgi:hypothetical protein
VWQHPPALLAHLDESYNDAFYFVGALVVPDAAARGLVSTLDRIMIDAATMYPQLPADTEIHAYEIVNAKGAWKPMHQLRRARIGIFEGVLQAIAHHNAKFIVQGINRERLAQKYASPEEPHTLALIYTMERINEYARHVESEAGVSTSALLIADEIDRHDEYRRDLWTGQRGGTWGYKAQVLEQLNKEVNAAPTSSASSPTPKPCCGWLARCWSKPKRLRCWHRVDIFTVS